LRVLKTASILSSVVDVTNPILILFLRAYSKTSKTPSLGGIKVEFILSL